MKQTVLVKRLNELSAKWKAQYGDPKNLPTLLWILDDNGELWIDGIKVCQGGDIGGVEDPAVVWDRLIIPTYYGYLEIEIAFHAGERAKIREIVYHKTLI